MIAQANAFLAASIRVALLVALALSALSQCRADITTGLVRHWKLDETSGTTATDSSGSGSNGTYVNAPTLNQTGKIDAAVGLDGYNDYVSLSSGVVNGITNCTIATWVNLDTVGTWSRIFDFGSSTGTYMFLAPKNGSTSQVRFAITTSGSAGEQQINTSTTIAAGTWYHVAVTLSGSVGTLYVNGVQVGQNTSMTLTPSSLGATTNNWLGRSQFSADPYLDGRLDEFRIYNRALSASDISELHTYTGASSSGKTILMVIDNSTIGTQESARKTQFESWGYTVTTIQDAASQASFDSAVASADVVYVCGSTDAWELAYKLRTASCGVVTEQPALDAEFGFSTDDGYGQNWDTIDDVVNTHPVTSGLVTGSVVISSNSSNLAVNSGTAAAGFTVLGTMNYGNLSLGAMDAGGALANTYNGNSTASGRRVRLPWQHITWSYLNANGRLIAQQALAWAMGPSSARYALDETSGTTVTDSSGKGHDGTYAGSPELGVTAPRNLGSRFSASGTTDMITLPNAVLDGASSATVGFWIRTTATGEQTILSGANSSQSNELKIAFLNDTTLEVALNNVEVTQTIESIATDSWIHFVLVIDSSSTKIYRDGELVATMASHGTGGALSFDGLVVGQDQDSVLGGYDASQRLNGSLDDLAIYSSALTEPEIAELYGLIAHWKLDEASGTTAIDSSLSGNDAFLTGTQGWISGQDGGGHDFNYTDGEEYFEAPSNTAMNDVQEGDYTIMAYFRPNSVPPGTGSDNDVAYGILTKAGWHGGLIYNNAGQFVIDHWLTGEVWSGVGTWNDSFAVNSFYHVAGVVSRTNGTVKIYVDGELKETATFTPGTDTRDFGTNPWRVGIAAPGSANWAYPCDGIIDDARIYNRALSDEEIAAFAPDPLVAHWNFDEGAGVTLADTSVYANNATFNTGTPTWTSGMIGGALQFSGSNDADTDANFDPPSSGSVAFWFRPGASPASTERLFGSSNSWEVRINASGTLNFDLGAGGGPNTDTSFSDSARWHHAVYNFDSNADTYEIYIDGEFHKSGSFSLTDEAAGIFSFGTRTGSTERFAGSLDDLRIYRTQLTPTEVAELYGIVGHWKMDEGSGTTIADSTAFANDATLSGATWSTDCSGNNALAFNGTGQTAATGSAFDPPEMGTVAFWFKSAGTPASRQRPWGLGGDFEMWQDTDGLVSCDVSVDGYQGGFITTEPLDEQNRWYHLVAQYDSSDDSYAIYVDGSLHKSGISTRDITDQAANVLTFGTRTGSTQYWEGEMRDFRVYNRFLQDYEISDLSAAAGHWDLDETSGSLAADNTVLSNDGAYVGLPSLGVSSVYTPENGTAVRFDGSTQYLTIPHNDAMLADNGTVMFWFRTDLPLADQGLFSKDSSGYDTGGHLTIRLLSGKVNVRLQSTSQSYTVESAVIPSIRWKHVAFTWGTGGMNLYIDGQLVDSEPTYTGGLGTTSGGTGNYEPIVLGANAWISGDLAATPLVDFFSGALDDLQFSARAFCADEIFKIYRGGRSPGVRILKWVEVR